jgi:diadenosine tetraphosphate (Ap4A) HIT family hydrolase
LNFLELSEMSVFQSIPEDRVLFRSEHFFIIRDSFPVSPGHLLIISSDLKLDYFELSNEEKAALPQAIEQAKSLIESEYQPDGFNIGMNCGETAGQTVMHFHCHVIPRFKGDVDDPRGGVRHSRPGFGYY